MKITKEHMLLYAVTDSAWLSGRQLADVVREATDNGVTCVQLREKNMNKEGIIALGKEILPICKQKNIPFIINDSPEIAKAVDADGVHVGQDDAEIEYARMILGSDKIIGTSAHNVEEAIKAQQAGADYIGVGAVFGSSTKTDAKKLDNNLLSKISQAVSIPVVAIGGINKDNISKLCGSSVDGVAVVSAIFANEDIGKATREMLELSRKIV